MVLLHIGYFNDIEDLKMMFNSPADEVIFNYKVDKGHFYKVEAELYNLDDIKHLNPKFTMEKDFAVVYDVPTDMNILNKIDEDTYCDFFIDVYEAGWNRSRIRNGEGETHGGARCMVGVLAENDDFYVV